ncbi:MAG TPA: hypothetical protein VKY32_06705 [Flavobacterium sp.]|nr:hypothetical protein [Flavobacterium sp.]
MSIALFTQKIKSFAAEHLSFLIIVIGGLSFLFANILLKEVLNEKSYGVYSLIVTFISIVYIYGLLGFEQVFLRYSQYGKPNIIATQKSFLTFIYALVVVATILSLAVYIWQYAQYYDRIWLVALAVACTIYSLFLFNIFRLNHQFVQAQLLANSWKIVLPFLALFFWLLKYKNADVLIGLILGTIVIITVFTGIVVFKKIKFSFVELLPKKETNQSFFHFFISISTLSLLLFGDRMIVEEHLGVVTLGDYFYLCNLVLAPYTLLQSYVGFRQLIQFKDDFSLKKFKKFNRQIIVFSLLLSILIAATIYVITIINLLNFDFQKHIATIALLIILGVIRLYSASILSAFEAKTSINTLKKTNILVILISIILLIILMIFFRTLNSIIIGFILLWFSRTMIYRYMLIKQIELQTIAE